MGSWVVGSVGWGDDMGRRWINLKVKTVSCSGGGFFGVVRRRKFPIKGKQGG